MKHLDLFSGIGGFALAVDTVWPENEHIFVDNDSFCQAVLTKHWPNSKIYGDIRTFITNPEHDGKSATKITRKNSRAQSKSQTGAKLPKPELTGVSGLWTKEVRWESVDIITGGFPCQPFSAAGKRKGTADPRHLWPEMFRVIQLTQPQWVIAENVRGLTNWNDGLVLEQVCTDLESAGYEVQPFIIPAVAVNAPHRRERVWIVAHRDSQRGDTGHRKVQETNGKVSQWNDNAQPSDTDRFNVTNSQSRESRKQTEWKRGKDFSRGDWERNWVEVATELCRVDDGLPKRLVRLPDGRRISRAKWRQEALKAYGNAIVPQVAIEIMRAIKDGETD